MSRERFEPMYQGQPPWDFPGPQRSSWNCRRRARSRGSVLDAGCCTAENALYFASRGHQVVGVDVVQIAIERARGKARERGLEVRFEVADALELDRIGRQFDSVIDSGLFHTFDDEHRAGYVRSLGRAVRPGGTYHLLCFSDQEPPGEGPRRVTQREIRDAFRDGWEVGSIREASFERVSGPEMPEFSSGGQGPAWRPSFERGSAR